MEADEIMADEIAWIEEAELEALASMNAEQAMQGLQAGHQEEPPEDKMDSLLCSMDDRIPTAHTPQDQPLPETPYGSDDDEYDDIFMDVIQEETRLANQSSQFSNGDQDMMDIS
jgi:hypothetical protein